MRRTEPNGASTGTTDEHREVSDRVPGLDTNRGAGELNRLVELARAASGADAVFLEQVDPDADEWVVVSTSGESVPSVGARGRYSGSFEKEVVERGELRVLTADQEVSRAVAVPCASCVTWLAPLVADGEPPALLVLLYGSERFARAPEVVGRVRGVAGLAALSIRASGRRRSPVDDREDLEAELREIRELYRSLYEDSPTIYLTMDGRGIITAANEFGARYMGFSPAELEGRSALEIVYSADCERFQQHVDWCLSHPGEVNIIEFRKLRKNGEVLWMREAGRAVRRMDGSLILVSSCQDIDERVRAERALRESEERFRQIAENIREVFWISSPDYSRLLYVSPAYERIWGRSLESVYEDPNSFLEAVHPEDRDRVAAALPAMAEQYNEEFRILRPDGALRWIHARAFPVCNEAGEVYRVVGVGEDVTERRRMLQVEREARAEVTGILERITDAFFALDPEWRFVYLNPVAREVVRAVLERDPDEAIGRSFWDVVWQLRDTRFEEEYRRAMETQTPRHFEAFAEVFGVWFDVHAYPSPEGLSVYFRDITERRRSEEDHARLLEAEQTARAEAEQRAREEEALRRAAEAVSAAKSLEEVIRQIATSALDATRADGAFVERMDFERECVEVVAVAGERVPPVGASVPYDGSFAQRVIDLGEVSLVHEIGEVKLALPGALSESCPSCAALAVPLLDEEQALGMLVLLRAPDRSRFRSEDVQRAGTFARLASLAFRKAQILEESELRSRELEKVMESRAHLMRGFSHDVKNPLGAADGHLQLLQEGILGELAPKQSESVGRARRSIRSALALINELVDLARAESGQIELHPAPLNVVETVRELVADFRAQAEAKHLSLEAEPGDSLPTLVADGERVRQVLANLLSNAVKYTPGGGRVVVSASVHPNRRRGEPERYITIRVRDTGPGIPSDRQEDIFREFTRLDPSAGHGAGLGLAISRRIARALGGEITVDSELGKGSTFTLWLPWNEEVVA